MNTTSPTSKWTLLNSRIGLTVLLTLVFFLNWLETMLETEVTEATDAELEWRQRLAYAASKVEGFFSFEQHDLTNMVAVFGYSISYYFGLPLLAIALASRWPGGRSSHPIEYSSCRSASLIGSACLSFSFSRYRIAGSSRLQRRYCCRTSGPPG